MKILKWLLPFFLCVLAGVASADTEQAIPPFSGTVVDTTRWLNQQEVLALEAQIREVHATAKAQLAILIVESVKPETIEQYSMRVAEAWKVGKKGADTGAIIVIAKTDRRGRIEVGYGLEGQLPDLAAKIILDKEIAPRMKENKPYDGLHAGIAAIKVQLLKEPTKAAGATDESKDGGDDFTIPYFDQLNTAGKIVAIVLGLIGGILLLVGVYGGEGGALLFGLLIPLVGGLALGLLVNIAQCIIVAVVAFIVALVVAFGLTIGGAAVGGLFGGGGASTDW